MWVAGYRSVAARHQRHALQRIVMRDAQMVAGRRLLARQHHVAEQGRVRARPCRVARSCPGERAGPLQGRRHVEPQRVRRSSAIRAPPRSAALEAAAGAGIERPFAARAGPRPPRAISAADLRARAEAGIEQAPRRQPSRAPRGIPPYAPTGAAPAPPSRARARPGPPRSPARIRGGSASRRYPRCAAGSARRPRAPRGPRTARRRRGPDAAARSGAARSA